LKKKFTLYGLFNNTWGNKKDALKEDTTPTLKRFFKLFGRKFWNLVTLNLMMFPMILPLLIVLFLYLGINKTPTANTSLLAPLYGANMVEQTQESVFLLDLFGAPYQLPAFNATGTYIGMGVCILFLVVTFGWQNIGATYILRGLVRGDPIFPMTDYFYAIKRNLKQGFFLGLIDAIVLFLLGFDFIYFQGMVGSFGMDLMYWAIIALGILYFFMRFYIYHLQITFELSIRKILKNALIFTTLGIKRNLLATLGMVLLTAICATFIGVIISIFGLTLLPIPLLISLFFYLASTAFMAAYAAYPIIDRYMIAPYVNQTNDEDEEEPGSDLSDAE